MKNNTPFNEEFYAVLKLVSGEEIFSKVCAFDENDATLIVLDHPVFIETLRVPKLGVPLAKVSPWLNITDQSTFIIQVDKIITMTEIHDEMYINMHKRYVRDKTRKSNRITLTPSMGYISTVPDARISLEKAFQLEAPNHTFE